MSDSLIEKGVLLVILLFIMLLVFIVAFGSKSPSCEELGGTRVYTGNQLIIVGKVPISQPRYKCVFEDKEKK